MTGTSPIRSGGERSLLVAVWGKDAERLAASVLAERLLRMENNARAGVARTDKNVLLLLMLLLAAVAAVGVGAAAVASVSAAAAALETAVAVYQPRNLASLVPRPLSPPPTKPGQGKGVLIPVARRGRAGASSRRSLRRRNWKLCWRNSGGWTPIG